MSDKASFLLSFKILIENKNSKLFPIPLYFAVVSLIPIVLFLFQSIKIVETLPHLNAESEQVSFHILFEFTLIDINRH